MTTHAQPAAVALAALLVGGALGAGATTVFAPPTNSAPGPGGFPGPAATANATGVAAFADAGEFAAYVRRGRTRPASLRDTWLGGVRTEPALALAAEPRTTAVEQGATATAVPEATDGTRTYQAGSPDGGDDRHSTTNVQVAGVDEPDLVKTDGETAFYSPRTDRYRKRRPDAGTQVIDVRTPARPETLGTVEDGGRLLLAGDTLVVLGRDGLTGYDVSTPGEPRQVWERPLDGRLRAARLVDGRLFVVTRSVVDLEDPCPLEPLGAGAPVACTEVYHPRGPVRVDATYAAFALAADTGAVLDSVGFVGTAGRSVVYASGESLYVTYTRTADLSTAAIDVVLSSQAGRLDAATERHLRELRGYDLSARARAVETRIVVRRWLRSLPEDERALARESLQEAWREYAEAHLREFVTTGVVKVRLSGSGDGTTLSVAATGEVPGVPLNQFSLSEHEGRLRVATTAGAPGVESENDLYVLDGDLDVVGSVTGMGVNERIYSVRYVGETAYVVTFRRIDPFHVVDLSDPTAPRVEGELKLPGYSSYLHPLPGDRVLGVGEEDGRVKVVVFDVSDPTAPTVADDYRLDEGWSAVASSHHAFLQDGKHGVFFLPGGDGGYVFGYEDGLELEAVVETDAPATRAIYVDDYMYVFAGSEVVVVDETTWERTTTLELD